MKHMHNFSFCPKAVFFMSQVSLQYPLIFSHWFLVLAQFPGNIVTYLVSVAKCLANAAQERRALFWFTVPEDTIHHTRKMQQHEQEASGPMLPHSAKWREMKASVQFRFYSVCDHSPESDATQLEQFFLFSYMRYHIMGIRLMCLYDSSKPHQADKPDKLSQRIKSFILCL